MLRPQQQPLAIARAAGHHACMPADTFADPAQQPIEILRRLENLARLGVVAQVRTGKPARCRVRTGELLTAWVPWMALRAGGAAKGRRWSAPAVGEQCLLIAPGGDLQSAIALPGIYSDAMPQGSVEEDMDRTDWSATDYMEHDRATGRLVIDCAQEIEFRIGGERRLLINATGVYGWPDVFGDGRISLVHHLHGGVVPGLGLTEEPV